MPTPRHETESLYTTPPGDPSYDPNDYERRQVDAFDPSYISPEVRKDLVPTEHGETHPTNFSKVDRVIGGNALVLCDPYYEDKVKQGLIGRTVPRD